MPSPEPLQPEQYYHIYNRGINGQVLFREERNYRYFLRLYVKYIEPIADTFAYCLLPNHFHLLVRIKAAEEQTFEVSKTSKVSDAKTSKVLIPSQQFSNLFNAYTKAINKRYGRVGSLFQGRFQAVCVDRDEYLVHLSRYIHLNPVVAELVGRPEDWEFSSYREFTGLRTGTLPKTEAVLAQFPSADAYREFVESHVDDDEKVFGRLVLE